ncbi:MAG TPA: response regulator [Terracidiphilus sp.]|jgi:DNA-binding NtrC family response regulator|nr:response regulator [Terracidiphilus sp.]
MIGDGALKNALVLDDDRVVAETLGMILTGSGYEVRVEYTAEAAIDLLARWSPDVAIIDILLPGMNGVDFSISLQAACPGCHVLLFTAFPGVLGILDAARLKGHEFEILEKPVPPPQILSRLADLLAGGGRTPTAARPV